MSCGQASSGKLLRKNTEVEAQFIFHHERGCFVRKHLTVVHFSPTGGTRRAALLLAEGPARRIDELDLTLPAPTGRTSLSPHRRAGPSARRTRSSLPGRSSAAGCPPS